MATTTLQVARREFGRRLGYGEIMGKDGGAWTTTTNLATTAVIISTSLRDYGFDDLLAAGSGDDSLQNLWAIILGTNNSGTVKRIKSYDASAAQITVSGAVLASETGSTDFEIHRYSPTLLREVLNSAARRAFPLLHLPVTRTLFTAGNQVRYEVPSAIIGKPVRIYLDTGVLYTFANNILSNGGFETYSSGFTGWSADANLTVAQETATTTPVNYAVYRDYSAAKLTNGTTGTKRDFEQTISTPGTHTGLRVSFSIWVYCLEANSITTQISNDSGDVIGTAAGGGVHGGTGWELLTQTMDYLTSTTTLKMGVSFIAGASTGLAVYVDEAVCVVGPTQEPELPGEPLLSWEYVPQVQGTTLRSEVVFPGTLPDKCRLRFEGKGFLSTLTAETDTIEIATPQTDLWYAFAKRELYERLLQNAVDGDSKTYERLRKLAEDQVADLSRIFALPSQSHRLQVPDWSY